MKRNVRSLAFVGFVLSLALLSAGCQRQDAGRGAARSEVASPAPAKIDTAAIEAELIKLERDWAGAAKTKNGATVRRVLADDVVITYPDGSNGTKADEVKTVENGSVTMDSWDLVDPKVIVLSADSAFITGRGVIRNGRMKDETMKKAIDISGEYRFLDIYARRDGKWQAVASQTTAIKTNR